jgi:MFS family permease
MTIDAAQAKRTIFLLAVAQALYSCCTITVFATAGIVGLSLAPDKGLATLPVTTFVLGAMFSTIPVSLLMQRVGRAPLFVFGAIASILGSILAVWAISTESFTLFCMATALQGVFQATSGFYRFAAAENATEDTKSLAISWVLTGGVVAAIGGTLISSGTADLIPRHLFAGSYLAAGVLALANLLVILTLRLPKPVAALITGEQRSWAELLRQPKLIVAMASAMVAYALMNLMMTAAPVAMIGCGFVQQDASWVIQWHVLAMFVPSFFTGQLIQRFGAEPIAALGMFVLILSAIVGLNGISFTHFSVALILLGLGWNFGFIGGTTMLTTCYRPSERGKVQAANDFGISALMVVASSSSGKILAFYGWHAVPMALFAPTAVVLLLIAWLVWSKPQVA